MNNNMDLHAPVFLEAQEKLFRKFMEAVRSIRFDEAGNLRIIYAPPALRGLFF